MAAAGEEKGKKERKEEKKGFTWESGKENKLSKVKLLCGEKKP